jgi:hypothetical protein
MFILSRYSHKSVCQIPHPKPELVQVSEKKVFAGMMQRNKHTLTLFFFCNLKGHSCKLMLFSPNGDSNEHSAFFHVSISPIFVWNTDCYHSSSDETAIAQAPVPT